MVSLAHRLNLHLVSFFRKRLQARMPEWAVMEIRPRAKDLGFFLGLAVFGEDFAEPFAKVKACTTMMAEPKLVPAPVEGGHGPWVCCPAVASSGYRDSSRDLVRQQGLAVSRRHRGR